MHKHDSPTDRILLDYLNKNLKKGYKLDHLRIILLQQGYLRIDVDRAVAIIKEKTKKDQEERDRREERERKEKEVVEIVEEPIEKKGFFRRLFGG